MASSHETKINPTVMVWAALIGNTAVMITKFLVALLSGSVALLAEAAHSLADTFNQVFLLISLRLGKKPADAEHPFGHGKERFFWAFITAIMIFFVGAFFSIYEGIKKLTQSGGSMESFFLLSMLTLGIAFVFEMASIMVAIYELRHGMRHEKKNFADFMSTTKDLTIKTVIFEDGAALLGLVFAAVGIYLARITGEAWFDGLASILIGLVLTAVAFYLAKESRGLLLGQSASKEHLDLIRSELLAEPAVEKVVDLLTMHLAPDEILLTAHLQINDGLSSSQQEALIDKIEKKITRKLPAIRRVFIEPEFLGHRLKDAKHG